ncbi:putative trans-sialidase, partial [Trypanosoma conorhini]
LYERKQVGKQRFVLVRLDDQLERVKEVLAKWEGLDNNLSESCRSLGAAGACDGSARRVGLLSNAGSATHWNDEYLGVDAAVSGATKVTNGFEFSGANSRAEWPVGAQGQNQRYHFANYNFALLATVTVNDPKDGASVFGVRFNGTDSAGNRLGLLCSSDKKWVVKSRTGETVAQAAGCEPSKPYRVLLTLQEGSFSFFVNGTPLKPAGADAAALAKKDSEEIAHFYFGADDGMRDAGGSVTVKNAQLFNRAFVPNEVAALQRKENEARVKAPKPEQVPRIAASAVSGLKNSAHGVAEGPSVAAGTGPATTDAAGSSAGDASVPRGAPALDPNNASAAFAKEAAGTVQREAGGGDGTARGRVSGVLSLLLLALWGLSALC